EATIGSKPLVPPGSGTGAHVRPPSLEIAATTSIPVTEFDAGDTVATRTFGFVELAAIHDSPYSPAMTLALGPIATQGADRWAMAGFGSSGTVASVRPIRAQRVVIGFVSAVVVKRFGRKGRRIDQLSLLHDSLEFSQVADVRQRVSAQNEKI